MFHFSEPFFILSLLLLFVSAVDFSVAERFNLALGLNTLMFKNAFSKCPLQKPNMATSTTYVHIYCMYICMYVHACMYTRNGEENTLWLCKFAKRVCTVCTDQCTYTNHQYVYTNWYCACTHTRVVGDNILSSLVTIPTATSARRISRTGAGGAVEGVDEDLDVLQVKFAV